MKRAVLLLGVSFCLTVACQNGPPVEDESGGQFQNNQGAVILPVVVNTGPQFVTFPYTNCDALCIRYSAGGELFCDSDCDGWFDLVELDFGYDQCDWFDPPFVPSPDSYAPICDILIANGFKSVVVEPVEALESQRTQLAILVENQE